jgi:hypothetical protein
MCSYVALHFLLFLFVCLVLYGSLGFLMCPHVSVCFVRFPYVSLCFLLLWYGSLCFLYIYVGFLVFRRFPYVYLCSLMFPCVSLGFSLLPYGSLCFRFHYVSLCFRCRRPSVEGPGTNIVLILIRSHPSPSQPLPLSHTIALLLPYLPCLIMPFIGAAGFENGC